jgi:hypothetical protein
MVVATMGPFAVPVVRTASRTTTWWLAPRMISISFAAFTAAWFAIALGLHVLAEALTLISPPGVVAAALILSCAVAARSLRRSRAMAACFRTPSRAPGEAAEARAARFGALGALSCSRFCAVAMLAMLLLPGAPWIMAGLTAIGLAERIGGAAWRSRTALAYGSLGVAVLVF